MADVIPLNTYEEFKSLTATHKYVVVDFWAEWCPPCKAMAPMFANLAKKYGVANRLAFAKVDVDENEKVAQEFGIVSMPSFLFLEDGEAKGVDVGGRAVGPAVVKSSSDGKVSLLKGADPRNLTLIAEELGKLAKAETVEAVEEKKEAVAEPAAAEKKENGTETKAEEKKTDPEPELPELRTDEDF
ncbi:thioredoxin-like protein [Podospora didyma]|uniref:Thioredoxin-like protein n=1 Tax=Podospora didyma TaxID=330526 RepID=A0AAE0KEN2_9PEZI|nr:thioredoxin-like protein [Podospora didyma]